MLRESLKGMLDLERLSTQLKYNRSNARDLLQQPMPSSDYQPFSDCAVKPKTALMHLAEDLDQLKDVAEDIHRTLVDEVPLGLRDGGLIRTGIDDELDRYRNASDQGHGWFSNLEATLRSQLNIPA